MVKRISTISVVLALLILSGCGEPPPAPWSQPNLVLVIIDTLRSDQLSAYGLHQRSSPHLDRLAAESYIFTRSLSTSTWTLPSTATMLTGLLPDQHGLKSLNDILPRDLQTVAERLRDVGYRTAAFTDGGFVDRRWGFHRGFQEFSSTAGNAWEPKDVAAIEASATRWLRENETTPFFLLVHTYETHQPYTDRDGFAAPFLDAGYQGPLGRKVLAWALASKKLGPADHRWALSLYRGEVARADHYLGRLLATLRSIGQYDTSAILVTSDHGEEFLEHGQVEHGLGRIYPENVSVPLILKPPGKSAESLIRNPVSSIDLAPMLLELAGVAIPEDLPGRSLTGLIAADGGQRATLVHGINSFPGVKREAYRLDWGSRSMVHNRITGRTRTYNRERDPGMNRPRRQLDGRYTAHLLARMQIVLGWSSPEGTYLVGLPEDGRSLSVPAESTIIPLGLWVGLRWLPLEKEKTFPLAEGTPHRLVFDLEPGPGKAVIIIGGEAGRERRVNLTIPVDSASGWTPLDGNLPPNGTVMPLAISHIAGSKTLEDEQKAELEALGYLER